MSKINKQVLSVSVNALYNKAKKTGYLDLKKINQLYLYDYYMDFTKGNPDFNNQYQILRNEIFRLRTRLDNLCNYKSILSNLTSITNIESINIAPVLNQLISVNISNDYNLDISEIQNNNYFDANNDNLAGVYLYISQVNTGEFLYNGLPLTNDIFVTPSEFNNIVYIPEQGSYNINIPFRVQDNNVNPLFSTLYNYTINVNIPITSNQPATAGDITLYRENRSTTVITLDMITSLLTPPYNDPEGNDLDAIRIDEISTSNSGVFYYNNNPVVQGLVISKEDIVNQALTHVSANTDDITSDVFNFSVRDTGSGLWSTNI